MSKRTSRVMLRVSVLAGAVLLALPVVGQVYPTRPVRMVVGFAPGGGPDIVARIVAEPVGVRLGQSVVVDNRGGANGILGAEIVARSTPDGHTLLITSASFAINPSIYRKLPFDPWKDFAPVSVAASGGGQVLAVHPSVPARTVSELLQHAKKPGVKLAYGSAGQGNATHLSAALFAARTGIDMTHVPYKSAGLGATALMGNEVQLMFMSTAASLAFVKSGRLRALAYAAAKRADVLPEVPTLAEAGVAGADLDASWYGVFAPVRTPPAVLTRLAEEIRAAVQLPATRDKIAATGLEADGRGPPQFKQFLDAAARRYAAAVRAAGIDPQ